MASRLFLCVIILCAAFLPVETAWSQAVSEPFSIQGVDVDVTANSSNAAKDQAIAEAQRQAFQLLLDRLSSPKDRSRIPKADGTEYVADYTIESERSSKVRYIATIDVRFNGAAVRKLFKNAGIAMIEPISRPVVVVPVFRQSGQVGATDPANPWRSAWTTYGRGGLVAVIIPSAADMGELDSDAIASGSEAALSPLVTRYRTGDVLIVSADLAGDGHKVELSTTSAKGSIVSVESQSYSAKNGETVDQLMARAVRDCVQQIESQARQYAEKSNAAPSDTVSAIVPVASLEDWVSIRDRLSRIALVRKWELVSLTRSEAAVIMHLAGDADKVKPAFSAVGLDLQPGDGFWMLKTILNKR
jgi:hypothetical protein